MKPSHFPKGMLPAERRGQQVLNAVNANAIASTEAAGVADTNARSNSKDFAVAQVTPRGMDYSSKAQVEAARTGVPLMNGKVKKGGGKAGSGSASKEKPMPSTPRGVGADGTEYATKTTAKK